MSVFYSRDMKMTFSQKLALGAGLLLFATIIERHRLPLIAAEPQPQTAVDKDVARLKSIATDQSHVMADVGYHFANLWFAGDKKNWPLAKFYFDETRSHLKWAVRVIPVRKTKAGDVELQGILDAVDNSMFSEIGKSIENKDVDGFRASYRKSLEGCYSCHKAAEKPYLRPQIPTAPPQPMINFDPEARWPE